MKQYKTVQVPATQKRIHEKTLCDLCGTEIKPGYYDVEEVEIRCRSGVSYPGGGSGKEAEIDMCSNCFQDKLLPWVISQGGKLDTHHWDY